MSDGQIPNIPFTSALNSALCSLEGRHAPYSTAGSIAPSTTSAMIPTNIFTSPAAQPSTIINLLHSSDVVVGPMTQFHGAVSIYQYMDTAVATRSMHTNEGIDQSRTTSKTSVFQKIGKTSMLLVLILLIIAISSSVVIYIEVTKKPEIPQRGPIIFGNNYEHGTFPNLGNGHLIIDRDQWGASELAKELTVPLKHPAPYVLVTHIGVQSKPCENIYKCSIKMRTIQDSAIAEKNLPDIQANFYVADDGNIYVGRGWEWANTYANDSLAICFMGDYGRYLPSDRQLEATQYLLAYALTNKNIELDYKLVAHNQTRVSKSPGVNVFRQIVNWPHFYPCGMYENPRCGSELGMPDVWDAKM